MPPSARLARARVGLTWPALIQPAGFRALVRRAELPATLIPRVSVGSAPVMSTQIEPARIGLALIRPALIGPVPIRLVLIVLPDTARVRSRTP
jgi:hypothetical protein